MISLLTLTVLLAQAVPPAPAPVEDSPEAVALAERVQRFYEKTKDYTASFDQVFKYKGLARKTHSTGTVQVKKPGFMRWDYETPEKKLFVLDGKSLYMYDPEDNEVQVKKNFAEDQLSAAVTFLWGRGSLVDAFHVTKVDKPKFGPTVLELVPKRPEGGFTKIYFAINADSGAVETSVIFDTAGNENKIAFSSPKTNKGISDSRFQFKTPKGAHETELN